MPASLGLCCFSWRVRGWNRRILQSVWNNASNLVCSSTVWLFLLIPSWLGQFSLAGSSRETRLTEFPVTEGGERFTEIQEDPSVPAPLVLHLAFCVEVVSGSSDGLMWTLKTFSTYYPVSNTMTVTCLWQLRVHQYWRVSRDEIRTISWAMSHQHSCVAALPVIYMCADETLKGNYFNNISRRISL